MPALSKCPLRAELQQVILHRCTRSFLEDLDRRFVTGSSSAENSATCAASTSVRRLPGTDLQTLLERQTGGRLLRAELHPVTETRQLLRDEPAMR